MQRKKELVVFTQTEVTRYHNGLESQKAAVDDARAIHQTTGKAVCVYDEENGEWIFAMQADGTVLLDRTTKKRTKVAG